jgi:hypothetical protein
MQHNWSGWPGAICINCGQEDQNEVCLAEHGGSWEICNVCGGKKCESCCNMGFIPVPCSDHINGPCEN